MSLLQGVLAILNPDASQPEGLLPDLLDSEGQPVALERIKGKILGVYFSAGWCPPCKSFSPVLNDFLAGNSTRFDVVYVSSDHSEGEMRKTLERKRFLRVPYGSTCRSHLQRALGVNALPTLAIVDGSTGKVITTWGRAAMKSNEDGCLDAWEEGKSGHWGLDAFNSISPFAACL
mmetsp:Transcript_45835/g.146199  ORF Transcript_45835/g.146199 Transcript_45835/m.146199 type:complete len:175 (-) Transcript_45835:913-1437(-)